MAKHRFRGALNAAIFPLLTRLQSRTVVQPGLDNNVKTTERFYGTSESADYSIPQLLYCENIIPTAEGVQSVGYLEILAGVDEAIEFDQAITLRDADENNFLFSPAGGLNYIYTANAGAWVSTNPISAAAGKTVSRAYVNGRTFICYEGLGIYEYNSTTGLFSSQAISGLSATDVRGIGASNNYLIAYTSITVYYSSLINPLDFVPSITTGAGFSIPQDVKAEITAILGTSGGFIIYTSKNAVAAVYTNNIRAPFTYKEISNAGGIQTYEQVSSEQSSGPQYIWGTGGLQKITAQSSEPVSAEVNDYFAGRVWESWDATSKQLVEHLEDAAEFQVKVAYVANRYLVLSYSVDNSGLYQYALIYDVILKRWGKLKLDHVDCFTYPYPNLFGELTYDDLANTAYSDLGIATYDDLFTGLSASPKSKRSLAFLSPNGAVNIALLDYNKESSQQGVAIFGKFQLTRDRMFGLNLATFEGSYSSADMVENLIAVNVLVSRDGKDLSEVYPLRELKRTSKLAQYGSKAVGINIAIAVEGTFALSTYLLEATSEGDR